MTSCWIIEAIQIWWLRDEPDESIRTNGDRDAPNLSNVAENKPSMHEIIHKNKVSTTSINNK